MSLVGPRPERPEIITQIEKVLPAYRKRLQVLPGVTGLAQVRLAPDTDIESVRRKLACDLYYIRQVDAWLDLRIMIGTAFGILGIPGKVTCEFLRIPSGEVVETEYRGQSGEINSLPELCDQSGETDVLPELCDQSGEMNTLPEPCDQSGETDVLTEQSGR